MCDKEFKELVKIAVEKLKVICFPYGRQMK